MTSKEFKEILINGSDESKYKAMSNANPELLNDEVFYLLLDLLEDNSSSNRFFAIFNLIEKFPESLSNIEGVFVDNIYKLLFDDYTPIVDRVPWALSIIGDKALDKLIEKYYSVTMDVKPLIIHAIGRGNFSKRSKDRVKILLEGLKSDHQDLRFVAMCEMMSNTPISPWGNNEWNSTEDKSIDFNNIYDKILPVAQEFSKHETEEYRNFSNRYIEWIEKAYNNT